jgi:hypothetical protein
MLKDEYVSSWFAVSKIKNIQRRKISIPLGMQRSVEKAPVIALHSVGMRPK